MSKRFTDTEKWKDPWFQDLPLKYKILWFYLLDQCSQAGIWKVNIRLAAFQVGETFEESEIKRIFGSRIKDIGNGKWFISKFIEFQYGMLSENSKPHQRVISELKNERLYKGYTKGIYTLEEKDKYKDKDKDKNKEEEKEEDENWKITDEDFEKLWERYPKKIGKSKAMASFKKSVKIDLDLIDIRFALDNYLAYIRKNDIDPKYIKHGATWFNQWRDWVEANDTKGAA